MLKKSVAFLALSVLILPFSNAQILTGKAQQDEKNPQYSYLYNTSLIKAISDNDAHRVEFLLYAGMDPNEKNDSGMTPLVAAAQADAQITEMLLNHGAKVNEPSVNAITPLMAAARSGKIQNVKTLMSYGANPNLKDNDGKTAMDYATENKHHKVALELIDTQMIQINDQDTALAASLVAAVSAKDTATMQKLLKRGATINDQNRLGQTAIIAAVDTKDMKLIKEVLSYRPNLELQDNTGRGPLMHAIQNDDDNIARLLIAQGANTQTKDIMGVTPVILAAKQGNAIMLKEILSTGADVNAQDKLGRSALSWAVENEDKSVFNAIIARNDLRPDLVYSQYNLSPLITATGKGMYDMVFELTQKGADTNLQDSYDNTALVYAVKNNDTKTAALLLNYGANPLFKNETEPDLAEIARDNGNTKLAAMLDTAAEKTEYQDAFAKAKLNEDNKVSSYMQNDERLFWNDIENIDEYIEYLETQTQKAKAVKAEREAKKAKAEAQAAAEKAQIEQMKPKAKQINSKAKAQKTYKK